MSVLAWFVQLDQVAVLNTVYTVVFLVVGLRGVTKRS